MSHVDRAATRVARMTVSWPHAQESSVQERRRDVVYVPCYLAIGHLTQVSFRGFAAGEGVEATSRGRGASGSLPTTSSPFSDGRVAPARLT